MHHEIRCSEEWCQSGSGTERKRDAARREAVGCRLKRPRLSAVVQRHSCSMRSGELSNCLSGAARAKHHDARPLQTPSGNGGGAQVAKRERATHGYAPTPRVARKTTMPRMPPMAPITQKRKVICVSAQPSRSKW